MDKYNWIPDLPDHRDLMYSLADVGIPQKVDLRLDCSAVETQGRLGSCTGNAIVGAMEYISNKNKKQFVDLSRLYVYYNEREMEGTIGRDSGAMLRDGIKSMVDYGVCTEELWPYDINQFTVKPSEACYIDGAKRKVTSYMRLNTLEDMKNCLSDGFPFVFGFSVYSNFESEVGKTGIGNLPTEGDSLLGGHAVLCVGFDDETQRFIIRNSWGSGWGTGGYFTMPFEYLTNRNLSDDFWTIRNGALT